MQPNKWETEQFPNPTTDSTFGKATDKDNANEVEAALAKLGDLPPAPFLLFVGVGVGNPTGAWGNPSAGEALDMATQRRPKFLADALNQTLDGKPLSVVSITFNVRTEGTKVERAGQSVYLDVNAKCPLVKDSVADKRTLAALDALARKAALLVVMNSVSQNFYPALLDLALAREPQPKQKERVGRSYVVSYGEDGSQVAYAVLNRKIVARRASNLQTLNDVLPPYDHLDL